VSAAVTLAKRIGKTPIVVKDCPGFLVNRLLFPYMNEALMLIEDGVSPETIDDAAKNFGMPVGPIALYDIIGLDTALAASRVLAAAYPERMSEPKILAAQVQAGRLGQKSGVGFYRYDSARPSGKLDDDLKDITAPYRKTYRACNEEEIISRLFMPMLVEAIHALGEEIVQNVETIDVSLILGIGFPPSRGGIFRWADSVGASKILELLQTLQFLGDRFRPPGELLRLARTGKLFYSDRTAKKDNTKGNTALEG
jgi:3-hydroxyacyl-CoA dehydrogenase/enoyl-CoA hydratase/3-hydroxybutyryl-CoA epimerase/3-hydroxyacyl-CoA dehydrogenase/enoyl-CoA hydratase/3-hydroxybutyryl-CoA epimerase/enoyl-CoA isomerase